jgi:hypothetical protein
VVGLLDLCSLPLCSDKDMERFFPTRWGGWRVRSTTNVGREQVMGRAGGRCLWSEEGTEERERESWGGDGGSRDDNG